MKTTVDISAPLLTAAKRIAAAKGTTLRALVEAGLRHVIDQHEHGPPFRLRDASFEGRGLQPPFRDGGWDEIREFSYEGRGG